MPLRHSPAIHWMAAGYIPMLALSSGKLIYYNWQLWFVNALITHSKFQECSLGLKFWRFLYWPWPKGEDKEEMWSCWFQQQLPSWHLALVSTSVQIIRIRCGTLQTWWLSCLGHCMWFYINCQGMFIQSIKSLGYSYCFKKKNFFESVGYFLWRLSASGILSRRCKVNYT